MALGRRHEQEDLGDLLSAAVTRCLQPASFQAQGTDKPQVPGLHAVQLQEDFRAATSNSRTNLGIGEMQLLR
ncbi:hypothetical protein LDENG_00092740 [Lucifuga dentata]|nr:hypothetical protein LDENG_00092740 [Lucifuga dentata]